MILKELRVVGINLKNISKRKSPIFCLPQVCESLERLDRLANVSSLVVSEDYLKNDVPFIVTDAMEDWPVMNTDDFWFDNVTEVCVFTLLFLPC